MIEGVIFDCDGVLANAQWMHATSQSLILSMFGVSMTPDQVTAKYAGISTRRIIAENLEGKLVPYNLVDFKDRKTIELLKKSSKMQTVVEVIEGLEDREYNPEELYALKETFVDKMIPQAVQMPGIYGLIQKLKHFEYKLGVASAPRGHYVRAMLDHLHLTPYFDAIVSGDMVEKKKPAPDIFLKAAQLMRVAPENSVVIEDAKAGMEGAVAGGMFCIGVVPKITDDYPTRNLVTSTLNITPGYIANLATQPI